MPHHGPISTDRRRCIAICARSHFSLPHLSSPSPPPSPPGLRRCTHVSSSWRSTIINDYAARVYARTESVFAEVYRANCLSRRRTAREARAVAPACVPMRAFVRSRRPIKICVSRSAKIRRALLLLHTLSTPLYLDDGARRFNRSLRIFLASAACLVASSISGLGDGTTITRHSR